ncbi:hypothetical protein N9M66_03610 [Litoreibacter sp.]|nr:hypothetical protein [Litoreibacter sp.]
MFVTSTQEDVFVMIDAAFDHFISDPQPTPDTPPTSPDNVWEDDWPEPAVDEFGANPIYDTGS